MRRYLEWRLKKKPTCIDNHDDELIILLVTVSPCFQSHFLTTYLCQLSFIFFLKSLHFGDVRRWKWIELIFLKYEVYNADLGQDSSIAHSFKEEESLKEERPGTSENLFRLNLVTINIYTIQYYTMPWRKNSSHVTSYPLPFGSLQLIQTVLLQDLIHVFILSYKLTRVYHKKVLRLLVLGMTSEHACRSDTCQNKWGRTVNVGKRIE